MFAKVTQKAASMFFESLCS